MFCFCVVLYLYCIVLYCILCSEKESLSNCTFICYKNNYAIYNIAKGLKTTTLHYRVYTICNTV